jgi:hypothetical protein
MSAAIWSILFFTSLLYIWGGVEILRRYREWRLINRILFSSVVFCVPLLYFLAVMRLVFKLW